jgi:hypothetical protein
VMFRKNIGARLARFRQIALNQPARHHDALEFSNGAVVLVTDLTVGQRATVLQLPASPIEEKTETPQPTARYETAGVCWPLALSDMPGLSRLGPPCPQGGRFLGQ